MDPMALPTLDDALDEMERALNTSVRPEVEGPMFGYSHDIYLLKYPSGEQWSLRIQKARDWGTMDYSTNHAIARHLKAMMPTLKIPKIIHATPSFEVLQWLNGEPVLAWTFDETKRHKLLDELAECLCAVWGCPDGRGDEYRESYEKWLTREVDSAIIRSLNNSAWGDPIHYLHRRHMIKDIHRLVRANNRMVVRHGDLNAGNVIMNGDHVSGIIDWDTAQWVPAPAAINHPLFIADIPGWRELAKLSGTILAQDRLYLEEAVREIRPDTTDIAALLASSQERQFFELSLRNRLINEKYIELRLAGEVLTQQDARSALNGFLETNPRPNVTSRLQELNTQLQADT